MTATRRAINRDRRGVAAIEAALILPPFLTLLVLIIQIGIYFTLQSALDLGVTVTAEALRSQMLAGSAFSPPAAAELKSQIIANGGGLLSVSNVAVDVQLFANLSAGAVPVADGTGAWGGSGSILVLRAQTTMAFLPGATPLSMTATDIVRRPPY